MKCKRVFNVIVGGGSYSPLSAVQVTVVADSFDEASVAAVREANRRREEWAKRGLAVASAAPYCAADVQEMVVLQSYVSVFG
ncbi:MAG: hypothetical protein WCA44_17970 [Acidobacteriaceae bacterium]